MVKINKNILRDVENGVVLVDVQIGYPVERIETKITVLPSGNDKINKAWQQK